MLFVCGNNYAHQFGQDSNKKPYKGEEYISPPQQSVLDATSISSYSIYYWHSVIITKSGEVMAAGKNRGGSIYKNHQYQEFQKFTKFEIRDKEGKLYHPISAVCGEDYTLYLVSPSKTSDKKQLVYSTYKRLLFFLNITDFNPVSIFGGCDKSAAIDEEGSIVFIKESDIKTVEQFDKFHLPEGKKAVSVSFCNDFFFVLSNDGEVFMSETDDINFKRENSLEKTKIIEISGIDCHCLAVSEDGKVFGYGSNDCGQLGIGKNDDEVNTFTEILALKDYTIVSAYAGADHSIFQTKSGKLLACGRNQYGQLLTSESSENDDVYSPIETEIKEGATFCVAGWWKSSVFINYIPLNSPNRKITIKETTKSTEEVSILKKENSQSQSDENFFIDENEEKQFHINRGKIGEGATSVTYKIIDKRTKIPMCKKILKYRKGLATIKDAQRAMNEFRVLYEIAHPCICKAICINLSEPIDEENRNIVNDDDDDDDEEEKKEITTIAIFLEYVKYGLKDVLKKKIDDTLKTRIVLDIVHAMKFIHKCGMMHRDLKVENIMLNSFFDTKIVDFGLVKISESILDGFSFVEDSLTKGIGTLAYMSPEMANEEKYDNKTDVYSFGVVLYFIFYGDLPKQSLKDKMAGKEIQMPSPTKSISKFCIKLIQRCLSYSPSKRPSFEEILTQLRENKYELAADVDPSILEKRDNELEFIENYK